MHSVSRWPPGGALLLGAGFMVAACAKEGPGDNPLAFGADEGGLLVAVDSGGTGDASGTGSGGNSGTGLNSPPPSENVSGNDASGGSNNAAPAGCDPTNCQSGWCANGACASGSADDTCGQGGSACTDCTATSQVCSFGACVNSNSSAPAPTDTGSGSSPGGGRPAPMNPLMSASTSCGGKLCTNACFPLGLPCCNSGGSCGCIGLYFLPCN